MYYIPTMGVFDKQLRKLMGELHIYQNAVCQDLGFSTKTFSKWYRGDSLPKIDVPIKLAEYFNVPISYFFNEKAIPKESLNITGGERRKDYIHEHVHEIIELLKRLETDQRHKILTVTKTLYPDVFEN